MEQLCILIFLGINSWKDLRTREVSLLTICVFGAVGVVRACFIGGIDMEWVGNVSLGSAVIILSICSKGAVGIGDGLLLLALGTVLSFRQLLAVFLTGLLCCSFWGILLLLLPRGKKTVELPFVPFLLVGYIGGLIC